MQHLPAVKFSTVLCALLCLPLFAQPSSRKPRIINIDEYEKTNGDAPANPGPLANLSGEMRSPEIKASMRKVADWQYDRIKDAPSQNWTFPPLYDGFLAASRTLDDPKYHDNVIAVGEHYHWTIGTGDLETNANEHALGYPYIQLFNENRDPQRIAGIQSEFEDIKKLNRNRGGQLIWWWCDALFMAPPTWSALSKATNDPRYLNYMDKRYHETDNLLWSPEYHLYFRDKKFLSKTESNGKPIFWSRGNGWVLAGLAMTLENIPASDPRRQFYLDRFQKMSAEVLAIQGTDGLWRTGLLDPDAYALPEVSGSAFFLYALAWGVNNNILSAETYKPAIAHGWAGLTSHIYADGRLGAIQPIGDSPGKYTASASYVYGVGAFLLAGSEIEKLSR
jgi:rhamnogalacturonyl hydrolase YesR